MAVDNVLLTFRLTAATDGHFRLFREKDAQVWDRNAGAWGSVTTVTAANAAMNITYTAQHKVGVVTLPAALEAEYGVYKILIYTSTQAAAAAGDDAVHIFIIDFREFGIRVIDELVLSV